MLRHVFAAAFVVGAMLAASTTVMAENGPLSTSGVPSGGECIAAAVCRPGAAIQTACRPASGPLGPILFDGGLRRFNHYC